MTTETFVKAAKLVRAINALKQVEPNILKQLEALTDEQKSALVQTLSPIIENLQQQLEQTS